VWISVAVEISHFGTEIDLYASPIGIDAVADAETYNPDGFKRI
jgi:hypothetical protein